MANDAGRWKSTLVMIPTRKEMDLVRSSLPEGCQVRLCGFGPVAAGIETAVALEDPGFERVVLLGIAGTYDPIAMPVGAACSFSRVACYGVGAGVGTGFRTPGELGLAQTVIDGVAIFDEIPLDNGGVEARDLLLTVSGAAAGPRQVEERLQKFSTAIAEDMEGFAVAMAALRRGRPVTVIRGMSNVAGDRDHASWQIGPALSAAARLLAELH